MKIALVQMEIRAHEQKRNTQRGLELIEQAAGEQADFILLPEIWTTGYALGHLKEKAERMDGNVLLRLREIARAYSVNILPGSVPLLRGDKIYNCAPAISRTGEIVNLYDKVHLFRMFEEEKFFAPGNNFGIYKLDALTCASTICYDLRFPELYRHQALAGAQLIFCSAEWPTARGDIWSHLARARAMENHLFVAAVNCVGEFKGAPFYGHSVLVDPLGRVITECGEGEEVAYAEFDTQLVAKVRKRMNALDDVRRELIQ